MGAENLIRIRRMTMEGIKKLPAMEKKVAAKQAASQCL
jgi:hypothetical protein